MQNEYPVYSSSYITRTQFCNKIKWEAVEDFKPLFFL